MVITFVADGVEGAWASEASPLVASGSWLQVFLGRKHAERILEQLLTNTSSDEQHQVLLPATMEWPQLQLRVTVVA